MITKKDLQQDYCDVDEDYKRTCYHIKITENKLIFLIDDKEKYSCAKKRIPTTRDNLNILINALKNNNLKETICELKYNNK